MKKLSVILLLVSPFIFFSCASNQVPEDQIPEVSTSLEPEANDQLSMEESPEEPLDATNETNDLYIEENDDVLIFEQPLEEIIEPDVQDAPIIEEPETTETTSESEESASITEPLEVEVLEDLTPSVTENEEELKADSDDEEEVVIEDSPAITDEVLDATEDDDVLEDVSDATSISENQDEISYENEAEEEPEEIIIEPSRKVSIKNGEYLDIEYPGKGWVYLGAVDLSKNLNYFGRKLSTENTKYTFSGKKEGTVILHFYKEDVLTGDYIDDYIEVEILPEKTNSKHHVTAPSYKEIVPKPAIQAKEYKENKAKEELEKELDKEEKFSEAETKQESAKTNEEKTKSEPRAEPLTSVKSSSKQEAQTLATKENTPSQNESSKASDNEPLLTPSELLQKAKDLYNNKDYKGALETALDVTARGAEKVDELLFLLGQIYESNSDVKDIKKSLEAYEKLISYYPASKLWDSANKRVIYLKRFYINVR